MPAAKTPSRNRKDFYAEQLGKAKLELGLVSRNGIVNSTLLVAALRDNPYGTVSGSEFRKRWQHFGSLLEKGHEIQIRALPLKKVHRSERAWLLSDLSFEWAQLTDCNFYDCGLNDTSFHRCFLKNCEASGGSWARCGMVSTEIHDSRLMGVGMSGATLLDSLIRGTTLHHVSLEKSALQGLVIEDSELEKCLLRKLTWGGHAPGTARQTVLKRVTLDACAFEGCKLKNLQLREVTLDRSKVYNNAFESVLSEDLKGTNGVIYDNRFSDSITRGSQLPGCKIWGNHAPGQDVDLLLLEDSERAPVPSRPLLDLVPDLEPLSF